MGQKPVEVLQDFHALRREVAALCDEVRRLRAEVDALKLERDGAAELVAGAVRDSVPQIIAASVEAARASAAQGV